MGHHVQVASARLSDNEDSNKDKSPQSSFFTAGSARNSYSYSSTDRDNDLFFFSVVLDGIGSRDSRGLFTLLSFPSVADKTNFAITKYLKIKR